LFKYQLGWIMIEKDTLHLYGLNESIDISQLEKIILKNELITFVDLSGQIKNIHLLKLDLFSSEKIVDFIKKKLPEGILVQNEVV